MSIKKKMIEDLVLQKDTDCFRKFYRLLQQMRYESRVRNDSAIPEEVLKIQGEIRLLNNLLKSLDPSPSTRKHYDGGFY
jgi:hypothetical protein